MKLTLRILPPFFVLASVASAQPVQWAANHHSYELVLAPGYAPGYGVRWDDARAGALSRTFLGAHGYLVTITSAAENAFLAALFPPSTDFRGAWTGGIEPLNDGHWRWADGPEAGQEYWNNNTRTGPLNNWGGVEPNNYGFEENYMAFYLGTAFQGFGHGAWYDSPRIPPFPSDPQVGYIVEYDAACIADCDDGSGTGRPDGGVTIDDLLFYLALFASGDIRADIDDGSGTATQDGGVTIDDLLYYLARFAAGC